MTRRKGFARFFRSVSQTGPGDKREATPAGPSRSLSDRPAGTGRAFFGTGLRAKGDEGILSTLLFVLALKEIKMAHEPVSDQTAKLLRAAWFRYLDTVGETRPALYRYCRRMTGNIWDAEDLLQDTLLRGFGAIGRGDVRSKAAQVRGPRAYLFRIATNRWIDQMRRRELNAGSVSTADDS